jgi:hypothetical protein
VLHSTCGKLIVAFTLLASFLSACGDDAPVVVSGSGGGEGTAGDDGGEDSSSSEAGSADTTAGEGGVDGGGPPCGYEDMLGGPGPGDYQLVVLPASGTPGQHFQLDATDNCEFSGIYDED